MPNKQLGQHWLHDQLFLEAVIDAGQVQAGDYVVEIGPGLGTLTKQLLNRGAQVKAVEFDNDLAADLPERLGRPDNLEVINQDILQFNFNDQPAGYKICGNIPYYLTSKLIRSLSALDNQPKVIGLLIQKEVAERIVAKPGKMSVLSIAAQVFAECSLGPVVPAEFFAPPPKINSQIISLVPRPKSKQVVPDNFFRVVKAGFGEKRKKLANSLSGGLTIDKEKIAKLLADSGFDKNVRAQELSVENWRQLSDNLKNL